LFKMSRNPEKATEFAYYCGVPLLLQIMEKSQSNLALQRNAIGSLLNLSFACAEYVLSQVQIFDVLVTVIKQHSTCIPLLRTTLVLMQRIAAMENEASLDSMLKANADIAIMTIIKTQYKKTELLPSALATLTILCKHRQDSRTAIATCVNLTCLVKIFQSNESILPINREAFKLMRVLSCDEMPVPRALLRDKISKTVLVRAGFIEKL